MCIQDKWADLIHIISSCIKNRICFFFFSRQSPAFRTWALLCIGLCASNITKTNWFFSAHQSRTVGRVIHPFANISTNDITAWHCCLPQCIRVIFRLHRCAIVRRKENRWSWLKAFAKGSDLLAICLICWASPTQKAFFVDQVSGWARCMYYSGHDQRLNINKNYTF